jgi:hypothetical protein
MILKSCTLKCNRSSYSSITFWNTSHISHRHHVFLNSCWRKLKVRSLHMSQSMANDYTVYTYYCGLKLEWLRILRPTVSYVWVENYIFIKGQHNTAILILHWYHILKPTLICSLVNINSIFLALNIWHYVIKDGECQEKSRQLKLARGDERTMAIIKCVDGVFPRSISTFLISYCPTF